MRGIAAGSKPPCARAVIPGRTGKRDNTWLDNLESQIGEHGAAVDSARLRTVEALGQELGALPTRPLREPRSPARCAGGRARGGDDAEALQTGLKQRRRVDTAAGRATFGPHRDDLQAVHAASGRAAARCSTGEQKAMLLSLILAHGDCVARLRGDRPILLLDEVAAHLDPLRRAALYERLARQGGQAWLTGTEAALFDNMPGPVTRFEVAGGRIGAG